MRATPRRTQRWFGPDAISLAAAVVVLVTGVAVNACQISKLLSSGNTEAGPPGGDGVIIVVPSLGHKYLTYSWGTYRPRPVEILITISTFAAMTLLYVLFSKFVPIISIWEMKVGEQEPHETALQRTQRVLGEVRP